MYRSLTIILLFVLCAAPAVAQLEWSNWVFGKKVGIRFAKDGVPLAVPETFVARSKDAREGTATWSDPCTGTLELTTEGSSIRDPGGAEITNSNLATSNNSSTQSTLFIPHPASRDTLYLLCSPDLTLFRPNVGDTIPTYSVLTLVRRDGTLPWRVFKRQFLGDRDGTERVTGTHDASGNGFWVFTVTTAGVVRAYHVTRNGFDTIPVESPLPRAVPINGQIKCSPDGNFLAVAASTVYLLRIDKATGRCTLAGTIDMDGRYLTPLKRGQPLDVLVYSLSFSQTCSMLYVSSTMIARAGNPATEKGYLHQFDMQAGSWPAVAASGVLIDTIVLHYQWSPSLQLAPNGVVYITSQTGLSGLLKPDLRAPQCEYTPNLISINANDVRDGLSSCIESSFKGPVLSWCRPPNIDIDTAYACQGGKVQLALSLEAPMQDTTWVVTTSDGDTVLQQHGDTSITLNGLPAGYYTVHVLAQSGTIVAEDFGAIIVYPLPPVRVDSIVRICQGSALTLRATGASTYRWSPADGLDDPASATPRLASVLADRRYVVTGTDTNGCSASDTVDVLVGTLSATIEAPSVVCPGDSGTIRVIGGTGITWYTNGQRMPDTTSAIVVRPTVRTAYTAVVQGNACADTMQVVVEPGVLPVTVMCSDTSVCALEPVTLSVSGGTRWEWSPTDGVDDPTAAVTTLRPSRSGLYTVVVTGADGCQERRAVNIGVLPGYQPVVKDTVVCPGSTVITADGEATVWADTTVSRTGAEHPCPLPDTLRVHVPPVVQVAGTVRNSLAPIGKWTDIPVTITGAASIRNFMVVLPRNRLVDVTTTPIAYTHITSSATHDTLHFSTNGDTDTLVLSVRGQVILVRPDPVMVDVAIPVVSTCYQVTTRGGFVQVVGCGIVLRFVNITGGIAAALTQVADGVRVQVEADGPAPMRIQAVDMLGRSVFDASYARSENTVVDVPCTGVVFVTVTSGGQVLTFPALCR